MKFSSLLQLAAAATSAQALNRKRDLLDSSLYGVLEFENVGFPGVYKMVSSIDSSSDSTCSCSLDDTEINFSGPNAPLNEELSVHIRGPASLKQFAYYVSEEYTSGSTSGSWSRLAYYDSASQTASNVTFLGNVGKDITCLGSALDYVGTDGKSTASSPQILEDGNLLYSNQEFAIFSSVGCEESGYTNDCGVYRDGIPAFHGFYGTTKMFLFEFEAPTESTVSTQTSNYDMPAIWLLNANIPRTAQYPTNENCSCWLTGCGEFDIFEVLSQDDPLEFYSTVHDYQGTGDVAVGLPATGYLERTPGATMMGGAIFGSDGTITVFLSNSTSIDATIENSDLNSWLTSAAVKNKLVDVLATIAPVTTVTTTTTVSSSSTTKSSTSSTKSSTSSTKTSTSSTKTSTSSTKTSTSSTKTSTSSTKTSTSTTSTGTTTSSKVTTTPATSLSSSSYVYSNSSTTVNTPSSASDVFFAAYTDGAEFGFMLRVLGSFGNFDAVPLDSDIEFTDADITILLNNATCPSSYYTLDDTGLEFTQEVASNDEIEAAFLASVSAVGEYAATIYVGSGEPAGKVKREDVAYTFTATVTVTSVAETGSGSDSGVSSTASATTTSGSGSGSVSTETSVVITDVPQSTVTYTITSCSDGKCTEVPTTGISTFYITTDVSGSLYTVTTTVPCPSGTVTYTAISCSDGNCEQYITSGVITTVETTIANEVYTVTTTVPCPESEETGEGAGSGTVPSTSTVYAYVTEYASSTVAEVSSYEGAGIKNTVNVVGFLALVAGIFFM